MFKVVLGKNPRGKKPPQALNLTLPLPNPNPTPDPSRGAFFGGGGGFFPDTVQS